MILLLFLFLTTPLTCLDSENNQPTYKFAIVTGAVDVANATTTLPNVASEDACVDKCEANANCVLAFVSSSLTCYLFDYGSITAVSKNGTNGTGEAGTVAFKVYTDQPACDLNLQFLLNGKNYPLNANDTTKNLWKIDTSEGGWTISYATPPPVICGNFAYNRPYPDSCNPECDVTMVQVNAVPGPLTRSQMTDNASSWEECMSFCHGEVACFVAQYMDDQSIQCRWWSITEIFFLTRMEAQDMQGGHMAIKIPLSPVSCKYTTEQLLDDKYYLPYNKILYAFKRSYIRIRTTPKYYKFNQYMDENQQYMRAIPGCESDTVGSSIGFRDDPHILVCVRLVSAPNITHAAANELCQELDGKLMTERYFGFLSPNDCFEYFTGSMLMSDTGGASQIYKDYGFTNYGDGKEVKIWMGAEKDNTTQSFKWQAPEWAVGNVDYSKVCTAGKSKVENRVFETGQITWANGQPDMTPGKDCAYLKAQYKSEFPTYGFYTARCDNEVADGFACGNLQTNKRGIPPFKQIADEYGVDPPFGGRYRQVYVNDTDIQQSRTIYH